MIVPKLPEADLDFIVGFLWDQSCSLDGRAHDPYGQPKYDEKARDMLVDRAAVMRRAMRILIQVNGEAL